MGAKQVRKTQPSPTPKRSAKAIPRPAGGTLRASEAKSSALSLIPVGVAGVAPMMAAGLEALFADSAKLRIVQAGLLELLRDPDLAVVLLGASSGTALQEFMATVRVYRPEMRMIVFSQARSEEEILQVLASGAKGHVHESASVAEIEQAVQIVASGSIWAPRRVLAMLIERLTLSAPTSSSEKRTHLTQRERQVMELLLAGHPNKEIARKLKIDEQTVKAYVSRLMRKIGVQSRTALTMYAVENAWLGLQQ